MYAAKNFRYYITANGTTVSTVYADKRRHEDRLITVKAVLLALGCQVTIVQGPTA